MHYNCLIVDDELELAKMTAEYFEMFDVRTEYVETAAACYDFFKNNSCDIILLDINLGDGLGFDVCKTIREDYQIPILFISARQSDDDVLIALSVGGDDYVKKPYSLSVLLAKVKVNLKRIEQIRQLSKNQNVSFSKTEANGNNPENSGGTENSGDAGNNGGADNNALMSLDSKTMSVIMRGKRINLKAKEFDLLKCLYERKNTIVDKNTLFDEVWGDSFYSDGTLNVHIRKLREKIEQNPNKPEFIKTIWGTGYILELK